MEVDGSGWSWLKVDEAGGRCVHSLVIPDREYDPSGNSNSSFHVGAEILNLLLF